MVVLLRGLHVAAMLSMLGTVGFTIFVLPAAHGSDDRLSRDLVRLWRLSGLLSVAIGSGWLILEAAAIADSGSVHELLHALPVVADYTRFGRLMLVRLMLLIVATLMAGTGSVRAAAALSLTIAAVALQGMIGHAGASEGATGYELIASETLHLLAAGGWLGALLPLWLAVWMLPMQTAAMVCERFSPIGLGCVLILAGTGFVQGFELIGSPRALLDTPYGHIALAKIGVFLGALGLAVFNRLWATDQIANNKATVRRYMLASMAMEIAAGLAIIVAAALLASTVPGMHKQ